MPKTLKSPKKCTKTRTIARFYSNITEGVVQWYKVDTNLLLKNLFFFLNKLVINNLPLRKQTTFTTIHLTYGIRHQEVHQNSHVLHEYPTNKLLFSTRIFATNDSVVHPSLNYLSTSLLLAKLVFCPWFLVAKQQMLQEFGEPLRPL